MEKKKRDTHPLDNKVMKDHKIFVGGLQGSGKTVCVRYLLKKFKRPIGVRMTKDFDDIKHLTIVNPSEKGRRQTTLELLDAMVTEGQRVERGEKKEPLFDCIVIDEADLIFINNTDIPEPVQDLIAMHRHYKIAIIFITRRPQDIPAKVVETCRYRFFYVIEGTNVKKYISNINSDIPDMLDSIDYESHRFVYHEIGKKPELMPKVPLV